MTSTPVVSDGASLTLNVSSSASSARRTTRHVVAPRGPFSLDLARSAVMRWAPVSRFAADTDRPFTLAAIADDGLRPVAFAVTRGAVDGPVTVEIAGAGDPDRALAQGARILSLDHDASGLVGPGSVATRTTTTTPRRSTPPPPRSRPTGCGSPSCCG